MSRDEVLQRRQTLAEVGADGQRDDAAGRVGHQTAHTGHLADGLETTLGGTRLRHVAERTVAGDGLLYRLGHFVRRLRPQLDRLDVLLFLGNQTTAELALNLLDLAAEAVQNLGLFLGHGDVLDGDGDAGARRILEAERLDGIHQVRRGRLADDLIRLAHQVLELALCQQAVDEPNRLRQNLVEDDAPHGGLDSPILGLFVHEALVRVRVVVGRRVDGDGRVDFDVAELIGHQHFVQQGLRRARLPPVMVGAIPVLPRRVRVRKHPLLVRSPRLWVRLHSQVVAAEDHILGGTDDGFTAGGLEQVLRGQHQAAGFVFGGLGQRYVNRHLVAVKVGIEGRADQRVDLDGVALDQERLERLDAQAVQRRRAVEQHRIVLDNLFEDSPDHVVHALDEALGALHVVRVAVLDQLAHHEGAEQFQGHALGQTALVQFKVRADDDDRAAGVVHALAEQVAAEAALLALEHVAQALELTAAPRRDGLATAAVVNERVDGLLEHTLLVADDDIRRA